jgi:hypothetical protein
MPKARTDSWRDTVKSTIIAEYFSTVFLKIDRTDCISGKKQKT